MTLNTVIVDDEQIALDSIKIILEDYCPSVKIVGLTTRPAEAIKLIKKSKPHLVITDIDMPGMDGFQMLESLGNRNFEIIFVTAMDHFAIKAFKVCAVDYILKPVNISEVIKAVNRVEKMYDEENRNQVKYDDLLKKINTSQIEKISLTTTSGVELVNPEEIIVIEAVAGYSIFHLKRGKKIMVSKSIGEAEELLCSGHFSRIHKATIVNLNFITRYNIQKLGGHVELEGGIKKSVSRRKRQEFKNAIESFAKKI